MLCELLFAKEAAKVELLRKMLCFQICTFTLMNTISALVSVFVNEQSHVEDRAAVALLILTWTSVPFGFYGGYYEKSGVTTFFVVYGVLSGCAKTVVRIVAIVMVASSCQVDQLSFLGCDMISQDILPCLYNSSCTKSQISYYNDHLSNGTICYAWGTNECQSSPTIQSSMGFSFWKAFFLVIDIATSCMPVYVAFLLLIRLESLRTIRLVLEKEDLSLHEIENRGKMVQAEEEQRLIES
eukprot:TRINITY_DN3523_c0_g1_i1.p1 TRINITY_DN3523_c0_g1~~TRINITY_DN3523_c0_g1_i1.p1  ORF type:complete len:272 (+),score=31.90 TRINITY_DN3523_c0_g1_i1:97-816(+)